MLTLNARFTLLAVLCCLSTLCLLPSVSVNAAVISRSPESSSHLLAEARSVDDATSHSQQFVLPWSSRNPGDSSNHRPTLKTEKRRFHKVRTTNPIQRFADAVISRIKHSGGHRKRSHKSIIIPTGHGKNYLIPHARRAAGTPQWISGQTNTTNESNTTSTQSENTGVPGAVRIQSQSSNSSQGRQTLGSLFLTKSDGIYTLNASENNKTRLFMVNAPSSTTRDSLDPSSNDNFPVYLVIPGLQDSKNYCATYNASPDKPEPMTMQQCDNYTATDGTSTSQTFMFNQRSSELRPTWVDSSNGTTQAASVSSDTNTNSTTGTDTATSAQSTSTGLNQRDDSNVGTQNVTLTWVPAGKMQAADISETPNDSQYSASSAVTTTMTQTVTVFQTGSTSSTLTSTSTSASSSASGLNVEVVGSTPDSSSASSASSMWTMDISSSSISSSLASPTSSSIDAAAIASSIASSASASMFSASAMASAADFSASASATSTSDPSSNTFVAAVMRRSPWVKAETR